MLVSWPAVPSHIKAAAVPASPLNYDGASGPCRRGEGTYPAAIAELGRHRVQLGLTKQQRSSCSRCSDCAVQRPSPDKHNRCCQSTVHSCREYSSCYCCWWWWWWWCTGYFKYKTIYSASSNHRQNLCTLVMLFSFSLLRTNLSIIYLI